MKSFNPSTVTAALLAFAILSPLRSIAAAPAVTSFPSVSITRTNYVNELLATNGVTIGGVRRTAWPSAGAAGSLTNNASTTAGQIVKFTGTDKVSTSPASSADIQAAIGASVYSPYLTVETSLTHAGTVSVDFSAAKSAYGLSLTGAVTLASSNLAANHEVLLFVTNPQITNCAATFPAWPWAGGPPSTFPANSLSVITIRCRTASDTNTVASFALCQ